MAIHAMDLPPISGGEYGAAARPSSRPAVIVVGYDGSPASRNALAYAAARGGRGGQVVVVHVYAPSRAWFGTASYQPIADATARLGMC